MSTSNMIKFNTEYVKEIMADAKLTLTKLSNSIGMADSYMSNAMNRGTISKYALLLISKMYDADYEKLIDTSKPNALKTDTLDSNLYAVLMGLGSRVAKLEDTIAKMQESKNQFDSLSTNEKIILLLKQMTMYGGCDEQDFIDKSKEYGFTAEQRQFAINFLKCRIDSKGKSRWIIRK